MYGFKLCVVSTISVENTVGGLNKVLGPFHAVTIAYCLGNYFCVDRIQEF